jgi:hypothetical protein
VIRSDVYDNSSDQFTSNTSFIEVESDVKTKIKSPFSAAFGMQYLTPSRNNAISFTLEYFHQIDLYDLFDSDFQPVNIPDRWNGSIDPMKLMTYSSQASSVTNLGIGVKKYISPSLFIVGGFRTDFTSGDSDLFRSARNALKVNQIHFNKYHITLGPLIRLKKIQIITGIQYSFGRNDNMSQVVNYSNPVEYIPEINRSLEGTRNNTANAKINEISLFFGIAFDSE